MAGIDISIERAFEADDFGAAWALLSDTQACLAHYPKLETLTHLGGNSWRWELEPTGTAGFSHAVCYAVTYHYDREAGTISWEPVPGEGNAAVHGAFHLSETGNRTRVTLVIDSCLDVPVPRLLKSVIGQFARNELVEQVEGFVANLESAINARPV